MEHNVKFNHDSDDISAYGIDEKRANEINRFMDVEIFGRMRHQGHIKKSQAIEAIVNFANNPVEACIITGYVTDKLSKNKRTEVEVHIVDGQNPGLPDDILHKLDKITTQLSNHVRNKIKKDNEAKLN